MPNDWGRNMLHRSKSINSNSTHFARILTWWKTFRLGQSDVVWIIECRYWTFSQTKERGFVWRDGFGWFSWFHCYGFIFVWFGMIWFALVWFSLLWFGLVGFGFEADVGQDSLDQAKACLALPLSLVTCLAGQHCPALHIVCCLYRVPSLQLNLNISVVPFLAT